jgi:precorrin-6B C5,15-methyltransferase / cobalt-precorrin-6B C5,C15-methyltransferase
MSNNSLRTQRCAVTLIGIGDDGCIGLTSRALEAVAAAQWLIGGERQLAFFPQFRGETIVIKDGLNTLLDRIADLSAENNLCVLASGDPFFYGIGSLVIQKLGAEHVAVVPHPSSVQWAFARIGLKWDDATILSLHGRSRTGFLTRIQRHAKVAILTDAENSPSTLAKTMAEHNEMEWDAWVCENLCGPGEQIRHFSIAELSVCEDIGPLNIMVLKRSNPAWRPPPAIPFLHEDAFAKRMPKKGLITKREVRLLSLAALAIRPDSVVWDIGAGSGSVGIEAALLAPLGRVYAVEVDPEGVQICRDNAFQHGVDNITVIEGRAPAALANLEAPDAVFVGGSKGSMQEIIDVAFDRLKPGGHIVVNAITLENSAEAYQAFRTRGITPDVTLLQVSRAEPLAHYMRYEAMNPIQIFAAEKPAAVEETQ